MALFVYVTELCRKQGQDHNVAKDLDRFQERVELSQSMSLFDPFPPPYYVKKKLGGRQCRLIAERRSAGEHAVVIFLSVLIRGERAYEDEFARDPHTYGNRHFSGLVSDQEIEDYVAVRTAEPLPQQKAAPAAAEYGLLYNAFAHQGATRVDDLVCESHAWVNAVSQDRISKQIALFHRPCVEAWGRDPGLHFVELESKPGWGVWALRSPGRLVLITPSTDTTKTEAQNIAEQFVAGVDLNNGTSILRASLRAYPALILAADELWIDLERELVANMALSPEETEVLESARKGQHPFPLFINGRAGSGKSTILQYLFADLLYCYLAESDQKAVSPPLYLTVNGELLRLARSFVERLLRSEAAFAQTGQSRIVENNAAALDGAFREFQPFVLSHVSPDVRAAKFARAKRVDYAAFRRIWVERFGRDSTAAKDYPADLSWHIIRSYIKGMSSESYLEPEDYIQLPENQKTVTPEAFKAVYEKVWSRWYQPLLESDNLWDDQDLARYVVDEQLIKPHFPAVFCDEAQDFTRLELELLLRLNLFSDRALNVGDISRVPFAFAGDQFQTLNPTGFRWESIKSSFVEKFILELDPARRSGRTDLNYRELEYNYRSTYEIVRFGNHVQALRASLFQAQDLKPQIPWALDRTGPPVVWFKANDAEFWKAFHNVSNSVIIVPCGENEEADFVKNDTFLMQHVKVEDGIPLNVLSASRAKGCEYPAVIVYGFGAASERDVMAALGADDRSPLLNIDSSLPLQYFINRLYVAVSRPKRQLIVVDTETGFKRLWKASQDEATEDLMLAQIKNGQAIWKEAIAPMTMGLPAELGRAGGIDPSENAKLFENDGRARKDPFLMRQASQSYRNAGDIARARECQAWALEFEGQYLLAGTAFLEAGFAAVGLRCLWEAGPEGWTRIVDAATTHPQIRSELEYTWAEAITTGTNPSDAVRCLLRFADMLDDRGLPEPYVGEPVWTEAIESALEVVLKHVSEPSGAPVWNQLCTALDRIRKRDLSIPHATSASVFFKAERLSEAIVLWERSEGTPPDEYHRAKATVEPYPQRVLSLSRIAALSKVGASAEIVAAFRANSQVTLSPEQTVAVIDALLDAKHWTEAARLADKTSSPGPALHLALSAFTAGERQVAIQALHWGVAQLIMHGEWDPVVALISTNDFPYTDRWKEKEVRGWVSSQVEVLRVTVVKALARSSEFVRVSDRYQGRIREFLRQFLRVKGGDWLDKLTVYEAGAALERGGRFVDAIMFYEAVGRERIGQQEAAFARQRWVVCKHRQLEHERFRGTPARAKEIESDIALSAKEARTGSVDSLPEFPELPVLVPERLLAATALPDTAAAQPGPQAVPSGAVQSSGSPGDPHRIDHAQDVPIVLGAFKFDLSRRNLRCNITHTGTMEIASLRLRDKRCDGEAEFAEGEPDLWFSRKWNLTVRFPTSGDGQIWILAPDYGISFAIRIS